MTKQRLADQLTLRAPTVADAEAIFDVTARAFAAKDQGTWLAHCRNKYFYNNTYDWAGSTIGLLGDKIVTHWGIWGYRLRVGRAKLRMAGLGAVATDETMRKQGLGTKTGHDGVRRCRDVGYDISLLFGRPNYYELFGYVPAGPGGMYVVNVDALPTAKPARPTRRFRDPGRADIADVYNRCNRRRTGTVVRPTALGRWGKARYGLLWTDEKGKTAGYVILDAGKESLNLADHAGDAEQVLRVLAREARRGGAKEISLMELHHDDPVAAALRRESITINTWYRKSGGAMFLTLNLRSALTKLAGELAARLKASPLSTWRGQLLIADPREKVTLAVNRGKVSVLAKSPACRHGIRGGEELVRLLLGVDDPAEIIARDGIRLTGDAKHLAPALFPNTHCTLPIWDHF